MEKLRHCILQVNVICSEPDEQDPRKVLDVNEYTGTCFRINPHFLSELPFFTTDKIFFVTNFHVCDDADDRLVHLRTAPMGKSMFTAYVEAVVPKLDVAILSISPDTEHDKWFLSETPNEYLHNIKTAELCPTRISSKTRKVSTIGFPQGLENQVSSGWLAGRGSDEEEMLQLNMSINSGNSGGPLFDDKGRVIGICTSTLGCAEAIAFAVPAYSVINYFLKFYSAPYGHFPVWGFSLLPMTQAFKKVHKINGTGAVVNEVHPKSCMHNVIKSGDVIHSVGGHDLDMFGLMKDETRGSKITIHNTEFMMSLEPEVEIVFSRKSRKNTIKVKPIPIHHKVTDNFKEWCPRTVVEFGPFIFQNLSTNLMTSDEMPTCKNIKMLGLVEQSKSTKEIVIISKIDPNSYVASFEKPEEFDELISINRTKVKSMKDVQKACEAVRQMQKDGEKYFSMKTTSGEMWFTISKVLTKKRKRN
jgi:S1-C subfamily serine protease